MNRLIATSILFLGSFALCSVDAAPRDPGGGNAKVVAKLQAMVKELSSERDALKTERDTVKSDVEKLKSEIDKLQQEKAAAVSAESRLSSEISVQKNNAEEVKGRLDKTNAKLLEIIDKYNALNKAKNALTVEHGNLQNTQKQITNELSSCENKNIKLFEATKEIVDKYQQRGVWDSLFESEPLLQIKSVETETLLQEYEDKLNKHKYQKASNSTENSNKASEPIAQ